MHATKFQNSKQNRRKQQRQLSSGSWLQAVATFDMLINIALLLFILHFQCACLSNHTIFSTTPTIKINTPLLPSPIYLFIFYSFFSFSKIFILYLYSLFNFSFKWFCVSFKLMFTFNDFFQFSINSQALRGNGGNIYHSFFLSQSSILFPFSLKEKNYSNVLDFSFSSLMGFSSIIIETDDSIEL